MMFPGTGADKYCFDWRLKSRAKFTGNLLEAGCTEALHGFVRSRLLSCKALMAA
jgi:hypothetical protein